VDDSASENMAHNVVLFRVYGRTMEKMYDPAVELQIFRMLSL
jgi:hypothetical protein